METSVPIQVAVVTIKKGVVVEQKPKPDVPTIPQIGAKPDKKTQSIPLTQILSNSTTEK